MYLSNYYSVKGLMIPQQMTGPSKVLEQESQCCCCFACYTMFTMLFTMFMVHSRVSAKHWLMCTMTYSVNFQLLASFEV